MLDEDERALFWPQQATRSQNSVVEPRGPLGQGVVLWEGDASPDGLHGYGDAIAERLAAAGVGSTTLTLADRLPHAGDIAAPVHIITGGATSAVEHSDRMDTIRRRLRRVLDRASVGEAQVVGVCFGAQLIAATLAGLEAVGPTDDGVEVGLVPVGPPGEAATDAVSVFHYHAVCPEAVEEMGGTVIFRNSRTAVQGYTVGPNITGLQFHPERDPDNMRATVEAYRDQLPGWGGDPEAALASIDRWAGHWRHDLFDRFVTVPALSMLRAAQPTPRLRQAVNTSGERGTI